MKRSLRRPWDKDPPKQEETSKEEVVPYVTVKGVKYYSDRFYLNRTASSSQAGDPTTDDAAFDDDCTCGYGNAPPLFDRRQLIAELDLRAAILATYSVDPQWCLEEFPSLFAESSSRRIPTLVLHGQRGFDPHKKSKSEDKDDDDHSSVEDVDDNVSECSFQTQPHERGPNSSKNGPLPKLSSHVVFSEITSSWIPPTHIPLSRNQWLDDQGRLSDNLLNQQQHCHGVHHPKYMLL